MLNEYEKNILNGNEALRNNLDIYIEAFVKVYGEERREEITEKFKTFLPIAYIELSDLKTILYRLEKKYSLQIEMKYIKEAGFTKPDGIEAEKFVSKFMNRDLLEVEYGGIFDYINYVEESKKTYEQRKKEHLKNGLNIIHNFIDRNLTYEELDKLFEIGYTDELDKKLKNDFVKEQLKKILDKNEIERKYNRLKEKTCISLNEMGYQVNEDTIDQLIKENKFENVDKLVASIGFIKEELKPLKEELKPYQQFVIENKKLSDMISEKYERELLQKLIPYLSKDTKKEAIEIIEKGKKVKTLSEYENYFGYIYPSDAAHIKAFTTEKENILSDPTVSEWKKKPIIKERIDYFRTCGFRLGDEYEKYKNSPEVKSIIPSNKDADEIVSIIEENINTRNIEFFKNQGFNAQILEEIENLNLLDKDTSFKADIYIKNRTCVNPNIRITENGPELFSLLLVNTKGGTSIDHHISHELNHVLELSLISAKDGVYELRSGWDTMTADSNEKQETTKINTINKVEEEKRNYELFNEIINEMLAQKVTEELIKSEKTIFTKPEEIKYKHITSYEETFFLVKDFFNDYFDEIVQSRQNGNIDIIYNKVGKENFDALNDLFTEFRSRITGFEYYRLVTDLNDGIENEDTKFYKELLTKRDKILLQMKEYSLVKEETKAR